MCRAAGIPSPTYEEIGGAALVTFWVRVGSTARVPTRIETGTGPALRPESILEDSRTPIEIRVLAALAKGPLNRHVIVQRLGHKSVSGAIKKAIADFLRDEWIEYTIPEKPNSRLQQYRLTLAGERVLKERFGERQ
jgi:hypothetical protein